MIRPSEGKLGDHFEALQLPSRESPWPPSEPSLPRTVRIIGPLAGTLVVQEQIRDAACRRKNWRMEGGRSTDIHTLATTLTAASCVSMRVSRDC